MVFFYSTSVSFQSQISTCVSWVSKCGEDETNKTWHCHWSDPENITRVDPYLRKIAY